MNNEGHTPAEPSGAQEEILLDLRRLVLPIVTTGTDLTIEPVGTAFIIYANEKVALALSAAHCFHHIAKLNSPHEKHHETILSEFRPRLSDIDLHDFKGRVLYPDLNGQVHVLNLAMAYALEPGDIAVCRLEIPDSLPSHVRFNKRITIDSSPPKVGTRIAAIGYSGMEIAEHEIKEKQAHAKVNLKLTRRQGHINNVFPITGPRNQPYPCFQCTTPFDHGMSGGPIIDVSEERPVAIGIISSDLSFDVLGAGSGECALASILWPAMCTKMKREILIDTPEPYLIDFEKVGLIEDRGQANKHVQFTQNSNSGELIMQWN